MLKEDNHIPPLAHQLQQKWRQKQIEIFFQQGRPIYGRYINEKFIYILTENLCYRGNCSIYPTHYFGMCLILLLYLFAAIKFQGGERPPGGEGAPIYKYLSQL